MSRLPATIGRTVRPDRFARNRAQTIRPWNPGGPGAPARPRQARPWPYPKRASKRDSSRDPFFQTNMHDLPLLLGCKLQFGCVIIVQPSPQNLQDFAGRFSRRANYEDAPELLLILTISPFQCHLYGFLLRRSLFLFFLSPLS